jgi:hypothetical protein
MKAIKTLVLALVTLGLVAAFFVVAAGPATAEELPVASAAAANGDDDDDDGGGGGGDAVFGAGAFAGFLTFSVDATSGPLGENPSGTFRSDASSASGSGFVTADATCLVVTGNTATFGGRITDRGGIGFDPIFFAPGRGLFVTFQDNSPATPAPDLISGIQSWPTVPMTQAECLAQPTFFPIDGNVTVHDNTAADGGGEDDDDGEDDG